METSRSDRSQWIAIAAIVTGLAAVVIAFALNRIETQRQIDELHVVATYNRDAANALSEQVTKLGSSPNAQSAPVPEDVSDEIVRIPGPPGEDGRDGQDGRNGPRGAIGRAGSNGTDGTSPPCLFEPTGCVGPSGPAGQDGTNGINGTDGAPGEQGMQGPGIASIRLETRGEDCLLIFVYEARQDGTQKPDTEIEVPPNMCTQV